MVPCFHYNFFMQWYETSKNDRDQECCLYMICVLVRYILHAKGFSYHIVVTLHCTTIGLLSVINKNGIQDGHQK